MLRWKQAMRAALYGPDGFFVRPDIAPHTGPAAHFRTSAHASPLFAAAIADLAVRVDQALGQPDSFDLVDVGAGRGELLLGLLDAVPEGLRARLRPIAVELAARPAGLPDAIGWTDAVPDAVIGLLVSTEWLDNVPVDVVEVDESGQPRYVLVDRAGQEAMGEPVSGPDADWLARWWPVTEPGTRAEIGLPRDEAWSAAVSGVVAGLALTVDYGHLRHTRPAFGTLTGFRSGRQVPPTPDGSCDLTAHVAMDSLAAVVPAKLLRQAEALGLDRARPDLALASTDPAGYVRALSRASQAAELTDPHGLGGHWWLTAPIGCDFWSYQEYAS